MLLPVIGGFLAVGAAGAPGCSIWLPVLAWGALLGNETPPVSLWGGGVGSAQPVLCFLALWVMWLAVQPPLRLYWALTLVMVSAFSVLGALPFFVLFELSLVPIAVLILLSGGRPERIEAVLYMAVYTLVGGGLHVLGLVYITSCLGSFSFLCRDSGSMPLIAWLTLSVALLIKVPCYGVHLWLPKAHVEAPTGGSMVLAGVMLNLGIYGLVVYSSWCFIPPQMSAWILNVSLLGSVAASVAIFYQVDMKALAAYSSVVHMAVSLAALSLQTPIGVKAALLVAVGHGLSSSVVFLWVGGASDIGGTRNPILLSGSRLWGSGMFLLIFAVFFGANSTPPFFSFWGELACFLAVGSVTGVGGGILLVLGGFLCPAAYFMLYFRAVSGQCSSTLSRASGVSFLLGLSAHLLYLLLFFGLPVGGGG